MIEVVLYETSNFFTKIVYILVLIFHFVKFLLMIIIIWIDFLTYSDEDVKEVTLYETLDWFLIEVITFDFFSLLRSFFSLSSLGIILHETTDNCGVLWTFRAMYENSFFATA